MRLAVVLLRLATLRCSQLSWKADKQSLCFMCKPSKFFKHCARHVLKNWVQFQHAHVHPSNAWEPPSILRREDGMVIGEMRKQDLSRNAEPDLFSPNFPMVLPWPLNLGSLAVSPHTFPALEVAMDPGCCWQLKGMASSHTHTHELKKIMRSM